MIDYFAFYLKKESNTIIRPRDISACFEHLSIPPYGNIPQYLSLNSKKVRGRSQKYIKTKNGYIISKILADEVQTSLVQNQVHSAISISLRDLLNKVPNNLENNFLEEAIKTFEIKAYRASIIMVWLLTIDHLYEYVLNHNLPDFIAALRRMGNSKNILKKEDFGDLKESVFIEACRGANIVSNDVRKILDTKLGIRNSYAHPSTISLSEIKAQEFIDDLVNNVILKY